MNRRSPAESLGRTYQRKPRERLTMGWDQAVRCIFWQTFFVCFFIFSFFIFASHIMLSCIVLDSLERQFFQHRRVELEKNTHLTHDLSFHGSGRHVGCHRSPKWFMACLSSTLAFFNAVPCRELIKMQYTACVLYSVR